MGFKWVIPPTDAFGKMYTAYEWKIIGAILTLLRRRAPEIQNWMKENRPWTDRTGNARASLTAEVFAEKKRIVIELTMGRLPNDVTLEYARYLEFAHGGKYAIIAPTIDLWTPVIMSDLQKLLR